MIRVNYWIAVLLVCFGVANADTLKSASRWDIAISPYSYGLQGELVRAVDEYRTAVNQTGIQPGQDRQLLAETGRLLQLLKSRGYYKATLNSLFDEAKGKPKYSVQLGKRYRISGISIQGNFQPFDDTWQSLSSGDPLSAVQVIAQQARLRRYIEDRSCYFNLSVSHEVVLNESNQTAEVTFNTAVSDPTAFNWSQFEGFEDINESFLVRVSGIREGGCYQRQKIDNAVIALFDTGLFKQVRPTVNFDGQGRVTVTFALALKEKRTVNASLGWESEQGFGVKAGWQHRDLFGSAQSLSLQTEIQSLKQQVSADIAIPSFLDRRNRLNWGNTVTHLSESTESTETITFSSIATLKRNASVDDYFEYGVGYTQTDQKPEEAWERFRQIRLPLKYQFDSVKSPFNPSSGYRVRTSVEPIFDIGDDLTPYIKTGAGFQVFLSTDSQSTLASRVRWDSLWYGEFLRSTLENIPDIERYSAGGSTSVRGYGYQSIQLNSDSDDSVGGTQRWLVINELRLRLNDSWGLVGFWDIGRVAPDLSFDEQHPWYHGVGAGVRYYTRFAPIRFDVAFPMNGQEDDASFLFYVSLGQAF
jgi:translocation and assembly module TamA